ncbi:MAG: hypothetical protein L3J28_04650 [Candidatus Polarisedimenticolaceae bacterium]|nr:hypothetical protein [Candidatus Polarisedimenticolaceae bacterium]
MTLVLLDTNAYLRLAKRVHPMLGVKFGQKNYVLTILKVTEDEVHKSSKLRHKFPWFDNPELTAERLAKQVRLKPDEKQLIDISKGIFRQHVLENAANYKNPPSPADCHILAFGQLRPAMVVTDDLSMHQLAEEFDLHKSVWHGHELLHKMLSGKHIGKQLVMDIYDALECNNDLPRTWREVKHTTFKKVFGSLPVR